MKVAAHLYDPVSGKRAVVEDDYDWEDMWQPIYQWTDGNYGCDCNRLRFMALTDGILANLGSFDCGNTVVLEKLVDLTSGVDLL